MSTKSANRTISVSIYALVWIVLIILQTLVTTVQGTPEMSVFTNPRLYYSTWLTDLYLVVIFYLNYFVLAPRLMRRRLFQPYLWMTLAATPVSSLGVIGVVAAMAIGLSVRGLYEWDSLGQEVRTLKEEKTKWDAERDELQRGLTTLKASVATAESREALPSGEETTDTL